MISKNKKAQGLSINTVILVILGLITLVLVAYFAIGGFQKSGTSISQVSDQANTKDIGTGISGIQSIWGASFYCCQDTVATTRFTVRKSCDSTETTIAWGCPSPGCDGTCKANKYNSGALKPGSIECKCS